MENFKTFFLWKQTTERLDQKSLVIGQDPYDVEYEGLDITLNNQHFKSRLAKKTPDKVGYFIAVWKKDDKNKNIPFEVVDIEQNLVINITDGSLMGRFIFDKEILTGKMAFRIYPPWERELNQTAERT
ncbi:MepB protein [Macrococcus hajekii]|uniref:MepB protein n=1 Tax=Macrococcus hajekii TaxID=198482 RepID=A0A4R6BLR9_9STAP|nr:MepB family protein [Macrococcus hajekii]TDM02750.1 MepB protein [Macrococcus hajekii]GGB03585.1 hypothetical protein GCM10007190_09500 [Macrococcus hajekii]